MLLVIHALYIILRSLVNKDDHNVTCGLAAQTATWINSTLFIEEFWTIFTVIYLYRFIHGQGGYVIEMEMVCSCARNFGTVTRTNLIKKHNSGRRSSF